MKITKKQLRRIIKEEKAKVLAEQKVRRIVEQAIKMRGPAEPTGQQGIIRGLDMMDEHGDIRDESGPFKQMTRNPRYRGLRFKDRGTGPSGYGMLDVAGDIGMLKDWFVNWYAGGDPYAADDFDEFVEMM